MKQETVRARIAEEVFCGTTPQTPTGKEIDQALMCIHVTHNDLRLAANSGDIEGVAQHLAGLIYEALAMGCNWGINLEPVFAVIASGSQDVKAVLLEQGL